MKNNTNKASGDISIETDNNHSSVGAVVKSLLALGFDASKIKIQSVEQFVAEDSDGFSYVFAYELPILRVCRSEYYIWTTVDGESVGVKPLSARVRIVCR